MRQRIRSRTLDIPFELVFDWWMRTGALEDRDAMAHVASLSAVYPRRTHGLERQPGQSLLERSIRRDIAQPSLVWGAPPGVDAVNIGGDDE